MAPSAHGLHGTADLSLLTSEAPPIELPPPRFSHAIQGFAAVMDESLVMRVLAQESGIVEAIERDWPVRALRRLGRSAICWAAGPGILCNQRRIPSPKDCAASEVSRAAHRSAFGGRWQARESTCSCWTRAGSLHGMGCVCIIIIRVIIIIMLQPVHLWFPLYGLCLLWSKTRHKTRVVTRLAV
jgi:hypothetical protein